MAPFLEIDRSGAIVFVTMNRPETRNALSEQDQFDEFVDLAATLNADPSIAVAVLTGAGSAFCAGGNIKQMRERRGIAEGPALSIRDRYRAGIQTIPKALYDCEVPMIAAVNGPAVGAGCDLACLCDIRIAGTSARFAESFTALGIIPGDGGAWLLQRAVGYARAAEMTFTAEAIDAQTALAMGLVTRVVPDDELGAAARDLAERIARQPPRALRLAKRLLRQGQTGRLDEVLELSAAYQGMLHETADHAEAVAAFMEKRPAVYRGA